MNESRKLSKGKELLPLTFPRIPPERGITDFLHSRTTLKSKTCRLYQWEKPRYDPELQITGIRRVYLKTEAALEARREFYKEERVKLEEQWKELFEKEEKFQDTVVKINGFIKGNEEKRLRSKIRCEEDKINQRERTKDIEKLKNSIQSVTQSKIEIDENIAALKIYENYLNSVVNLTEEFKSPEDLISRYEALISTKNLLGYRQATTLEQLEQAQSKTLKTAEENGFKILGLNNTLANLNSRYQIALTKSMHWENIVLNIKKQSFEKFQEINQVKQACRNIYKLMCRRKGELDTIDEDDCEKQLNYIKKTLQELKTVKEVVLTECKNLKIDKLKKDKKALPVK